MSKVQIRNAQLVDLEVIASLSRELGYPVDEPTVRRRFNEIKDHPDHRVLVSVSAGTVVGYIHTFVNLSILNGPIMELAAFVVSEGHRGKGIGKSLLKEAKNRNRPFEMLRVRCNTKRKEAHRFYLSQGFVERKEQKVFDLVQALDTNNL